MSDVNLLPEELRKKEEQEQKRHDRAPKRFDIVLTDPNQQKAQKQGWFSRLFGKPVSPIATAPRYQTLPVEKPAVALPVFKSSVPVNLPLAAESEDKVGSAELIKGSVKYWPEEKKELPQPRPQMPVASIPKTEVAEKYPAPSSVKMPEIKKTGWWDILKSFFSRSKQREPKVRLAKVETAAPVAPQPAKPAVPALPPVKEIEKVEPAKTEITVMATAKTPTKATVAKTDHHKAGGYHTTEPIKHNRRTYINLIPSELLKGEAGGINWLRIILAMVLPALLIFCCYLGISLLQTNINKKIESGRTELAQLQKSIGDYNERAKINNDTANRVLTLKKILDNRIYWSKFFALLEKYTLDGVYFNDFKADVTGLISLPATADNYEVVARQLVALSGAKDFVKDAKTTSLQVASDNQAGITGVNFVLHLTLADGLFREVKK